MSRTSGELNVMENIRAEFESAKSRKDAEIVIATIRAAKSAGFSEESEKMYNEYFKQHGTQETERS